MNVHCIACNQACIEVLYCKDLLANRLVDECYVFNQLNECYFFTFYLAGIITSSGRMIGERLSASGTRLNSSSPVPYGGNKSSSESVARGLKSVSRQSLLDLVSCRLGVGRSSKQQQQHQVRSASVTSIYQKKLENYFSSYTDKPQPPI